jgi:hypothetical protein
MECKPRTFKTQACPAPLAREKEPGDGSSNTLIATIALYMTLIMTHPLPKREPIPHYDENSAGSYTTVIVHLSEILFKMSRKQAIYNEILRCLLPGIRNYLCNLPSKPWWKQRSYIRQYHQSWYHISEFIHEIPVGLEHEGFTNHDFWFLNYPARSWIEGPLPDLQPFYSLIAYYIQELFKAVPDEQRAQLEWTGPTEDFSWARPKTLAELNDE